jgi:tRNA (guanine-N7-)-methyltransferase
MNADADLHKDVVPAEELELVDAGRAIEFVPADYFARQTAGDFFARAAPLEIDLGSGEGAFLRAMARRHPERNFLGIERLLGRVRKVCRAIAREGLTNARIVRIENAYALRYLLPLEAVAVAHAGFPDPWPKRYHQRRRLVQDGFMEALHGILVEGGELRIKTDDLPYFQWMEKVFARAKGYERLDWEEEPDYPVTDFERRFLEQGLPIYRARLRKVGRVCNPSSATPPSAAPA